MPQLQRAYPRAIGLVEFAARAGERGQQVRTWLGRTSPPPSAWWREAQAAAQEPGSGQVAERRARQAARDWGRFTRNFVVQGTAAEWALCWIGHLRRTLADAVLADTVLLDGTRNDGTRNDGTRNDGTRTDGPHAEIVYFLHDEVIVHTPQDRAEVVAGAVREAACASGELLFGRFPVEFPLQVAVVDSYDQAG